MQIRDLKRLDEILLILFEEGLEFLVYKSKLHRRIPLSLRLKNSFKRKESINEKNGPQILLKTFERLGPTFIKVGQMLSLRPDLIPPEYAAALESLQDKCPEVEFDRIKESLENGLGSSINKVFKSFDQKPIAAASISQVHSAVLKNGQKVVVKILRPGITEQMRADIEIMEFLVSVLEKNSELKKYKFSKILEEFKEWTQLELDLNVEASNARLMKKNASGNDFIKIPQVFRSSQNFIIYEYVQGKPYTELTDVERKKINFKKFLTKVLEEVFREVFEDGFFHADPHPGNILVVNKDKVAFVDFGIMGRFSKEMIEVAKDFFFAVMTDDLNLLMSSLEDMNGGYLENKESIRNQIMPLLAMTEHDLKNIQMSSVIRKLFDILSMNHLKVPKDFVLLAKTAATLEGIGIKYYPDFNFVKEAEPYFRSLSSKKAVNIVSDAKSSALKYYRLFNKFPDSALKIMKKIESGDVRLDINDFDVKTLSREIDRSSNRVSYSALIAAFIISGALLINMPFQTVFGINILSFSCFFMSLIFILVLFSSIREEAK